MKLYTMDKCSGCLEIAKRLKSWNIHPNELPLLLWQNLNPEKMWTAPVLKVGEKIYEYNEINTRDKLWNATHDKDGKIIVDNEVINVKKKLKIKRIQIQRTKTPSNKIDINQEMIARINVTMLRIINGIDINQIINDWSMQEKAAGMIMWRYCQHLSASNLRVLADMITEKAKVADPYHHQSSDDDGWK